MVQQACVIFMKARWGAAPTTPTGQASPIAMRPHLPLRGRLDSDLESARLPNYNHCHA